MQSRRRGIHRNVAGSSAPSWRSPQGNFGSYGSQNQSNEIRNDRYSGYQRSFVPPNERTPHTFHGNPNQGRNELWRSESGINLPHQNHEPWRHRTSSSGSDQSHQRRNFSNSNFENQNQRGRYNNERRFQQNNYTRQIPRDENNSTSHPKGRRPVGFKALENLLAKDSEELILELSNSKKGGFYEYLKANVSDDAIILFTKILRKVCDSSFHENKFKILQMYCDDFFDEILTNYISSLPVQSESQRRRNKYFWKDTDDFWNNVIKICENILASIPTFAMKVLPAILKSLHVYIPVFETQHNQHISDEIKENVKRLHYIVQTMLKGNEEKEKAQIKQKLLNEDEEEPPDDFRQISVYPSTHELIGNNRTYLRQNVIRGPYRSVDHYLDVQFRLLREDFVGPLRCGIANYKSESKKRIKNVKIHKKVRFLNPETINESYCIRVQFDFTKKKNTFNFENSRRFMFGSLLCFTADNFKTFVFGKVSKRKIKDLVKGQLIVGFDKNIAVLYNTDYIMIECSVYFEPYYSVLSVLKNMTVENFPMEKYIIYVDPSVQPPKYLSVDEVSYNIEGLEFSPLLNWPNRNFYNLNESQLIAFRAALTQEFTIIQGPPGTGKTFLGLKIAKTLLENKDIWYKKTPMLVICFTNHVLDQFLEGILSFTNSIMRVGGQSKNVKLQSYNLRNKIRYKVNPAISQQRDQVKRILIKIKNITENLKQIEYCHSVRAFDIFEDVVPNFSATWFHRATKYEILSWLLDEGENVLAPELEIYQNGTRVEEQLNEKVHDKESESGESDGENGIPDSNVDLEYKDDDIFEEVLDILSVQCSVPLLTLKFVRDKITTLEKKLAIIRQTCQTERPTFEELIEEEKSSLELKKSKESYHYLTRRLAEGKRKILLQESENAPRNTNLLNPKEMAPDDRWNLYFYWLNLYQKKLKAKLDLLNKDFREAYKVYEEMRDIENTNSMKNVLVVGMTTTGAARLRSTLQTLKSPIVIVEEAAEVLETHIITSLTKHCQQLVLIGDHQQLKPSTTDYDIEKRYNLGISLFERMILNNIQCYTLNVQYRMRPEIAHLIHPTIYTSLEDHPSVAERPAIMGVDNDLFFIDHTNAEMDCEGTSKKNYHEVGFLISFARHLILNGYKPEQITILTAYLGQMFELQKEKKKHKHILENMRISVLDNYQGEECDIILLSLVRNNNENSIGFLSIENRVCVALSRARNGLYVIGNMTQLCNASELWRKIKRTFEEQNAIGPELPLRCQVHTETVTYVKNSSDFLNIPEGGCNQICGANLVCGHTCTSFCHILDKHHENYKCRATCGRKLCDNDEKHVCKKMCYEKCGPCTYFVERTLPCGHVVNLECHLDPDTYDCVVPVSTRLPCGHTTDKPCHADSSTYRCPHPCESMVEPCGHACLMKCHIRKDPDHLEYKCKKPCPKYRKDCTVKTESHLCPKYCYEDCESCIVPVKKARTVCPHFYTVPCNYDVDEIICTKPCMKVLNCGHKCKGKCNEPCGKCEVKVDKIVVKCGHSVKVKCHENPDWKTCNKNCPLKLPCGHPCTTRCNERCTFNCEVMVDCILEAPCGHVITKIRCGLVNAGLKSLGKKMLLKYCNHPCRDQLKCGHTCSGSCGECSQGRIHKRCIEKCGVPLVCGHLCEFPCRQACRPCAVKCPYRCRHSACRKRCGEVCTPCKERCGRNCIHQKCTRFCGEICNVPPCEKPCPKILKCRHQCIGFCGDPCPQKCLVCDKEELTEIFFGFESEDARYVVLEDCGHIFENTGLEQWLHQNEDQISFKTCPLCKVPIKTTQRYSDSIKRAMADVAKVKAKSNGTCQENNKKREELTLRLLRLKLSSGPLIRACKKLEIVFQSIGKRLENVRKGERQPINKHELNAITSKLQILEHIIKICGKNEVYGGNFNTVCFPQIEFVSQILLREEDYITDQEIDDVNFELNRLLRMVEFSQIKNSANFASRFANDDKIRRIVKQIEGFIFSFEKFYDEDEEKLKQLLKDLSKLLATGIGISESEKREIVKAMGFSKGHWFKCPNGHPYLIGECGGAMQQATCNECGAEIGGSNHALLSTNAVATEMDGATYGAWSNAANLANHIPRDFI